MLVESSDWMHLAKHHAMCTIKELRTSFVEEFASQVLFTTEADAYSSRDVEVMSITLERYSLDEKADILKIQYSMIASLTRTIHVP